MDTFSDFYTFFSLLSAYFSYRIVNQQSINQSRNQSAQARFFLKEVIYKPSEMLYRQPFSSVTNYKSHYVDTQLISVTLSYYHFKLLQLSLLNATQTQLINI